MSAHDCPKQKRCSQPTSPHTQYILPHLRLLAPRPPAHLVSPVQHRQQLEHHNIRDEQDSEAPTDTTAVNIQHSAASQSDIPSLSSGHGFTPPPLLSPHPTASGLEEKQYTVVAPGNNIYFSRVPLPLADDGYPELSYGNLPSGAPVVTSESRGLSTQYPPNGNLQLQATIQHRRGQDYLVPTPDSPEALGAIVQSTIGVHQDQLSQPTIGQYPAVSTQQLPPVQLDALLQPNSQHMSCVNCPSIWRSHIENITFSDPDDKRISIIRCSYRDLQQHIYEAHQSACALCEDLFCYHLGKMIFLEAAKEDFTVVKVNLASNLMVLREHIREAHGGC